MKYIKEKGIYLGLLYINIIFILRIIEKSLNIRNFDYIFITLLFLGGGLSYCLYNLVLVKKRYKLIFTFSIFILIGIMVYRNINLIYNIVDSQLYNINELDSLIYKNADTFFYQYKLIFSILIPLIVPITMWLCTKITNNIILYINLSIVITLWYWNCVEVIKTYIYLYMFISIFTLIINRYLTIIKKMRKQGVEIERAGIKISAYALVIALVICKGISILPQEYEGKYYGEISSYFENMFAKSSMSNIKYAEINKFSLVSSGYNDSDKKLGGPMSLSYADVFKVKADKPHYLRGTVKDYYDGFSWKKTSEIHPKFENELSSVANIVRFVNDINKADIKNLTIYPLDELETTSFFTPALTFDVTSRVDKIYSDSNKVYSAGRIIEQPYMASYYNLKRHPESFQDINIYDGNYYYSDYLTDADAIMQYYIFNRCKENNYTFGVLSNGSVQGDIIYQIDGYRYSKYLQLPHNVPLKIYDLVDDIVKDCNNTHEKVKRIKDYLTKNYKYSLDVSEVPEGHEFVENFIYNEKKGYCTYFATAMTVFCRIAGVPARYVEGFKMPDNKDKEGLYIVSNEQAHAWCEVLSNPSYDIWSIADPAPTPYEERKRKEKEDEKRRKAQISKDNKENDISTRRNSNKNKENEDYDNDSSIGFYAYSDLMRRLNVVVPIFLYVVLSITNYIKNRRAILKSSSVIPLYNYYLRRLSTIYIIKQEFKGDKEFVQEISNEEIKIRMEVLVNKAYEEFYGSKQEQGIDKKEYYDFIEAFIKRRQNKMDYFLHKYFGM